MKGSKLGELEELILLATINLQPTAYGNAIQQFLVENADRKLTLSTIHVALQRLEKKGYLKSEFGEATPERGGRRKRYFEISAAGFAAVQQVQEVRQRMWRTIPKKAFQ